MFKSILKIPNGQYLSIETVDEKMIGLQLYKDAKYAKQYDKPRDMHGDAELLKKAVHGEDGYTFHLIHPSNLDGVVDNVDIKELIKEKGLVVKFIVDMSKD